jgi:hypothetical protein
LFHPDTQSDYTKEGRRDTPFGGRKGLDVQVKPKRTTTTFGTLFFRPVDFSTENVNATGDEFGFDCGGVDFLNHLDNA